MPLQNRWYNFLLKFIVNSQLITMSDATNIYVNMNTLYTIFSTLNAAFYAGVNINKLVYDVIKAL